MSGLGPRSFRCEGHTRTVSSWTWRRRPEGRTTCLWSRRVDRRFNCGASRTIGGRIRLGGVESKGLGRSSTRTSGRANLPPGDGPSQAKAGRSQASWSPAPTKKHAGHRADHQRGTEVAARELSGERSRRPWRSVAGMRNGGGPAG